MSVNIGDTTTPRDLPGYPTQRRDEEGNWTHTERYWINENNVNSTIPADGATTNQHGETVYEPGTSTTLGCNGVSINAGPAPRIKQVTLIYKRYNVSYGVVPPEDNPRRVSVNGQEIPIDDERLLDTNGGPFTQTQIDDAKSAGYTSLPFYEVRYEYTELDASFGWTESDITNAIQNTGSPPGLSSTTPSNWWKIGFDIEETSEGTVIRQQWVFNAAGFYPITT